MNDIDQEIFVYGSDDGSMKINDLLWVHDFSEWYTIAVRRKTVRKSYQVHRQRRLFLFKICLTQWGKNLPSWMLSVKNYSLKWRMQLKVKSKTWSKSKKFWKIIIINNVTNLYLYFSSIYILEGLSILVPICTF